MTDFDRFARFYDLDHGDFHEDVPFYQSLARRQGGPVLEVGCGTGRLLVALASAGFAATGLDISPLMLERAGTKCAAADLASLVTLVCADARDFALRQRFPLAVCAVNSFMHFIDLADQLRVLRCVAAHLAPDGLFAVDLFNPDLPALSAADGTLVHDYTRIDNSSGQTVAKFSTTRLDPAKQELDVTFLYDSMDAEGVVRRHITPFSLHYFWQRELELLLEKAGYREWRCYGSYDLDEYDATSPRLIVLATGPGEG